MHLTLGRKYLLEGSMDLNNWTATLPLFTAESEDMRQEFEVQETGR